MLVKNNNIIKTEKIEGFFKKPEVVNFFISPVDRFEQSLVLYFSAFKSFFINFYKFLARLWGDLL